MRLPLNLRRGYLPGMKEAPCSCSTKTLLDSLSVDLLNIVVFLLVYSKQKMW